MPTTVVVGFAVLGTLALATAGAETPSRVPFPDGYRNWFHVKSATVNEGNRAYAKFGGIHHIYANARALEGYKTGVFPEGSVLVFDVLEFKTNDDQTTTERARRHIDVMAKDVTRFGSTGGWGFEEFLADSRTGSLSDGAAQACASCHASRKDYDGVFSAIRP